MSESIYLFHFCIQLGVFHVKKMADGSAAFEFISISKGEIVIIKGAMHAQVKMPSQ